jgi:hypothetical protein
MLLAAMLELVGRELSVVRSEDRDFVVFVGKHA